MNLREIISYVFWDMANLRIAAAVLAGIATLAFATVVSVLSVAFSISASQLLDDAINPTTPIAGILEVRSRKSSGRFSREEFNTLMDRIGEIKVNRENSDAGTMMDLFERLQSELGRFVYGNATSRPFGVEVHVSKVVTAFPNDIFRFFDHVGKDLQKPFAVTVWSVPEDSHFLARSAELKYIWGGPFGERAEAPSHTVDLHSAPARSKGFRPRLGVIVNEEYFRHYLNMKPRDWDRRHQENDFHLPQTIRLGFHRTSADSQGRPSYIELEVAGVVNLYSGFYPDLIFTEDVARAYFLDSVIEDSSGKFQVAGQFPGEFAHRFDRWNTGRPLEPAPVQEPDGYFPTDKSQFDYVELRRTGDEPYDLVILKVSNWQTEGILTRVRDFLNAMTQRTQLDRETADRIGRWAETAATRDAPSLLGDEASDEKPNLTTARANLRGAIIKEMAKVETGFTISPLFEVSASGQKDVFDVEDPDNGSLVRIHLGSRDEPGRLLVGPPWRTREAMNLKLRRTLLRLKTIIETYGRVMLIVVAVLAVSTSLLMAFNYVRQKRRDIGLLLTNGAKPRSVLVIFLAQITILIGLGAVAGIALSYVAAPLIEEQAAETLRYFLEMTRAEAPMAVGTLLHPSPLAICRALSWIVLSAFIGAVYPVARALRVAPHQTVATGGS